MSTPTLIDYKNWNWGTQRAENNKKSADDCPSSYGFPTAGGGSPFAI